MIKITEEHIEIPIVRCTHCGKKYDDGCLSPNSFGKVLCLNPKCNKYFTLPN